MSYLFGSRQNKKNSKKYRGSDLTTELCPACSKLMKIHSMKEILNCAMNFIDSTKVSNS